MDDTESLRDSIYWDATSMRSDNTIGQSDDDFNTPIGSIQDLVRQQELEAETYSNDSESTISNEIKPQIVSNTHQSPMNFCDMDNNDHDKELDRTQSDEPTSIKFVDPVIIETTQSHSNHADIEVILNDDSIKSEPKLTSSYNSEINKSNSNNKTKRFKQTLSRQLSNTKLKITKSLSHLHHTTKDSSKYNGNNSNDDYKVKHDNNESPKKGKLWISKLRNSFRKIPKRFHSMHIASSNSNKVIDQNEESTSAVLGSDMGYFNFEEDSRLSNENEMRNSLTTPDKPRRFFTPDKYIPVTPGGMLVTMDDNCKLKSPKNTHKNSPNSERKSIFSDLTCTQQLLSAEKKSILKSTSKQPSGSLSSADQQKVFIQCIRSFVNTNTIQVRETLQLMSNFIGQHIDLNSDNLAYIGSSKLFYLEGLQGSKDIWILTNTKTRKQFIALKKSEFNSSWTSIVNILENKDSDLNPQSSIPDDQIWMVYPVKIMSKLTREFNIATPHNQLVLSLLENTITQSIDLPQGYNRTNWLILYSDISLIILLNDSLAPPPPSIISFVAKPQSETLSQIHNLIDNFTLSLNNTHAIIQASYPLDFMAFLLLKLFLQSQSNQQ